VCLAGRKIKHVNDRAADMFRPCEKDKVIANGDSLIRNRVGQADTVTGDYFYRELVFRTNSDRGVKVGNVISSTCPIASGNVG
jgi:hypothetical protein